MKLRKHFATLLAFAFALTPTLFRTVSCFSSSSSSSSFPSSRMRARARTRTRHLKSSRPPRPNDNIVGITTTSIQHSLQPPYPHQQPAAATISPLFRSTRRTTRPATLTVSSSSSATATASTTSNDDLLSTTIQVRTATNMMHRFHHDHHHHDHRLPKWKRRLSVGALSILTATMSLLMTTTQHVLAADYLVSTIQPLQLLHPSSVVVKKPKHLIKRLIQATALTIVIVALTQQVRVKKRQSLDATSEWGRYAAHPGARGRAVMSLCLQIIPYWVAGIVLRTERIKHALQTRSGQLFANGLLQLGPLYIKLGQIVSCREHLLPEEWKVALERLQDKVPARSGQDALDLARASIGSQQVFDETFVDFDTTPLAAASLGQVHRAQLRQNNDTVAVKIQRPYLRQIYDQDFVFLIKIAKAMDKYMGRRAQVGGVKQSWTEIFTDAKEILYREIDYRDEADNAIRFAHDFGLGKGGKPIPATAKTRRNETLPSAAMWLRTPYVYRNVSSEKVLVMEFVPSIKITNTAKLEEANVTAEEKEYLADSLARSYLRQFCVNKFFTTDPHPGNLGVERVNGKPRLVFYDFGQACELNSDQADGILDVIEAIVDSDADRCVEAFETMGVLTDDVDLGKVRDKVQDNFEKGLVKVRKSKLKKAGYVFKEPPKYNATSSIVNVTNEEKDSDVMKFFKLPAEYAFVARAISQMDGVGKSLDPDFDFISSAAPYIVEIKGATVYVLEELTKRVNAFQDRLTKSWMQIVNRPEYKR